MRKTLSMLNPTIAVTAALLAWLATGAAAPGQTRQNSDSSRSSRANTRADDADDQDDDADRDERQSSSRSRRSRNEHHALGVTFYNQPNMLEIRRVMPDSPAEDAGLRRGDEILSINEQRVSSIQQVTQALDRAGEDEIIEIGILRDGRRQTVESALGSRQEVFSQQRGGNAQQGQYSRSSRSPRDDQGQWSGQNRQTWQDENYNDQGYSQQNYGNRGYSQGGSRGRGSAQNQRYREGYRAGSTYLGVFLDPNDEDGVWITGVEPGSPAEEAGLRRGDEIVSIDDEDVESTQDVRQLLAQMAPNEEVELRIERNGRGRTIQAMLASRRQNSSQGSYRTGRRGQSGYYDGQYNQASNRGGYGNPGYGQNEYGEQGYGGQGYNSDYNSGAGNTRRGGAYYDNRTYGRRYQDEQDGGENY